MHRHNTEQLSERAAALNAQTGRNDGAEVTLRLLTGLDQLADACFARIERDAPQALGADSFYASGLQKQLALRDAIRSVAAVDAAAFIVEEKYLDASFDWLVTWLTGLCAVVDPKITEDVASACGSQHNTDQQRHRVLDSILEKRFVTARRSPLVLIPLFLFGVEIVVALTFDDRARAEQLRDAQSQLLPQIANCTHCHAGILAPGDTCSACGNPLWKYDWLTRE